MHDKMPLFELSYRHFLFFLIFLPLILLQNIYAGLTDMKINKKVNFLNELL